MFTFNFICSKNNIISLTITAVLIFAISCKKEELPSHNIPDDTLIDSRDGKAYKTVNMPDGKVWFAENLNYAVSNSKCYKGDDCQKCGRLYNYVMAGESCPDGWRLPTHSDWNNLKGVIKSTGLKTGTALKSKDGWVKRDGSTGNGTDNYGFNALACDKYFNGENRVSFWSSSGDGVVRSTRSLLSDNEDILNDAKIKDGIGGYWESVRCVKEDEKAKNFQNEIQQDTANRGIFIDARDGKIYKTVKMPDGKVWFAENLNYFAENSTCYENNEDNCKRCGRIYGYDTAVKVCPDGWHLVTYDEVNSFIDDDDAPFDFKSKNGWKDDNGIPRNGSDKYGLNILACSKRHNKYDIFDEAVFWWAYTAGGALGVNGVDGAPVWFLIAGEDDIDRDVVEKDSEQNSVRCVKDYDVAAENTILERNEQSD